MAAVWCLSDWNIPPCVMNALSGKNSQNDLFSCGYVTSLRHTIVLRHPFSMALIPRDDLYSKPLSTVKIS